MEESRARLVGDSCVPKLHSSLRCHVSFHTRGHACTHSSSRNTRARNTPTHRHTLYTYVTHTEERNQERLSGGGVSSSTPRKYSGQYIPPFLLSLSCSAPSSRLVPLLPFAVLFFLFRVVTSAKLRRESSQFRVVVARHK